MKTIIKILLGASLIAATSCSTELLDIEQQGVLTTSEYTTADDSEALQFIAAVYALYHGSSADGLYGSAPSCYRGFQATMSEMSDDDANGFLYMESADGSTYSGLWRYWYQTIYWCNMIIENLPENNVASETVKQRVVAEARAVRAVCMMYLVQCFGNPPLADHILDGSEVGTPAQESWKFIESELEAAATALPSKSGLGGQAAIGGRFTAEAAYAYLGKAQLWQKKYSDAASTLYNKVIATGKYALNAKWADYNSSVSDFSDENLWEFDFVNDAYPISQEGAGDLAFYSPRISWFDGVHGTLLYAWGGGCNPSKSFVDFMNAHDGSGKARYDASVMDVCTASTKGTLSNPIANSDGYIKIKDATLAEDLVGEAPFNVYTEKNLVYMRYAEVLLNYAEAVAQGGAAGALSGLEALNMIRRRAGLSDAPELSMDDADYGVKAERRAELYGEGHRYIDLVRWGDAPAVLADVGKETHTCNLSGEMQVSGITVWTTYSIMRSTSGGPGFKAGKNELFPIPQNEININPGLAEWQNPNW